MALVVKNSPAKAGDITDAAGPIPGSGRSPGGGHGHPLQYSCLENSMDEEPGGEGCRESDTTEATQHTHTANIKEKYCNISSGEGVQADPFHTRLLNCPVTVSDTVSGGNHSREQV